MIALMGRDAVVYRVAPGNDCFFIHILHKPKSEIVTSGA